MGLTTLFQLCQGNDKGVLYRFWSNIIIVMSSINVSSFLVKFDL